MLGVDAGFAGDRWDMVVKGLFSEVVESALADGAHKPSGELAHPTSRPRGPIGWASPGGTRTIPRPIRKTHFGQSTRRAPFSPHSISASLARNCPFVPNDGDEYRAFRTVRNARSKAVTTSRRLRRSARKWRAGVLSAWPRWPGRGFAWRTGFRSKSRVFGGHRH